MKTLRLTMLLCLFSLFGFSQTEVQKNQIDLVGNYSTNEVFRFSELDGAGSVENGNNFTIGINYNRKISEKIWVNTGVNYFKSLNNFNPAPTGAPIVVIKDMKTELIRIPIKLRIDLVKWFYIKTGFSLDTELSNSTVNYIDNQSGLAYSLACGINLNLTKQVYLNIEPEWNLLSIVPFNSNEHQHHFQTSGINFGIGFRF